MDRKKLPTAVLMDEVIDRRKVVFSEPGDISNITEYIAASKELISRLNNDTASLNFMLQNQRLIIRQQQMEEVYE